jgi:hypothetical protein
MESLDPVVNITAAVVRSPFGEVNAIGEPPLFFFLSSDEAEPQGERRRSRRPSTESITPKRVFISASLHWFSTGIGFEAPVKQNFIHLP